MGWAEEGTRKRERERDRICWCEAVNCGNERARERDIKRKKERGLVGMNSGRGREGERENYWV